jgi:hypothetical protein
VSNLIVFAPYLPNASTPYYWQQDQTGVMRRAVEYYKRQMCGDAPSSDAKYHQEQIEVLVKYFDNYLMAPCWRGSISLPLFALRQQLPYVCSIEQLDRCHQIALELGADPL